MVKGLMILSAGALTTIYIGINIVTPPEVKLTSLNEPHELQVTYDLPMLENVKIVNLGTGEVSQENISNIQDSQNALNEEVFFLAATMWGEARGEGKVGMAYVGHVIKNRADRGFRGHDIKSVVLTHKQFSCWNRNDPNREKLSIKYLENTTGDEKLRWEQAKILAERILHGSHDYTNGALHYHASSVSPKWRDDYKITTIFKHHIFYR